MTNILKRAWRRLVSGDIGGPIHHDRGPLSDYWYQPVAAGSQSGVAVTTDSAMRVSTFYACVKLLSEAVASLPLFVFTRDGDEFKRATDHWLYDALHDRPNRWQTSMEWRELAMNHLCTRGNFVCRKVRSGGAYELWPMSPDRIEIHQLTDGSLRYTYRKPMSADRIVLMQEDVLHVRMMTVDGVWGMSPVSAAREALGMAIASESHGANFFQHRAFPGMVLKYPPGMSPDAKRRARETIAEMHAGFGKAYRTMILPDGVDLMPLPINNADAQFLESRNFQVSEIARFFLIPPHMIGATDKTTSWGTGIEQQTIGFVTYTLRPYLVRFEQAFSRDLLLPMGLELSHYVEFAVEGLLRGDSTTRADFYAKLFNVGVLSVNEIRKFENLGPIGADGDRRFVSTNLSPLGGDEGGTESPDRNTDGGAGGGRFEGAAEVVADVSRRIAHANIAALRRRVTVAEGDWPRFEAWASAHATKQRGSIARILSALNGTLGVDARAVADRIANMIHSDLMGDRPAVTLGRWETGMAAAIAEAIAGGRDST